MDDRATCESVDGIKIRVCQNSSWEHAAIILQRFSRGGFSVSQPNESMQLPVEAVVVLDGTLTTYPNSGGQISIRIRGKKHGGSQYK